MFDLDKEISQLVGTLTADPRALDIAVLYLCRVAKQHGLKVGRAEMRGLVERHMTGGW